MTALSQREKSRTRPKSADRPKPEPRRRGLKVMMVRLFADPWRKGASIVLAILLWYFLDSQITKTKTLVCQLLVTDNISASSPTDVAAVEVRISERDFTVIGFRDPRANDAALGSVKLTFEGADHLIDSIRVDEMFGVRSRLQRGVDTFFEFDMSMIDCDRDLRQALVAMDPPRVKLVVEPNESREVALSHDLVLVTYPPKPTNGGTYGERLLPEASTFLPPVIRLLGTKSKLAAVPQKELLFEVDLTGREDDFNGTAITAPMKLRPAIAGLRIKSEPERPEITIPLRPVFDSHVFEVPVILDTRASSYKPDDFEPIPDHKVTLSVSGNLANELNVLSSDELLVWVQDNLRVVAHLPRDTAPDRPIVGQLTFLKNNVWEDGKDYRYEMLPVTLKPKKQD